MGNRMLKRLLIAAAILAGLSGTVQAAGTIPAFSLTPQFDKTGKVAIGCKAYTIQAGTTATPQNSYQDSALTILQPNPIPCDSTGRLPQFFLADGQIKIRLVDKNGVEIFVGDNLLVIGPSSGGGGGGGGSVDPTTIATTGDMKASYGTSVLSGWVRANGRTIGSATSGATERANADCNALFVYLWGTDANLAVSGGRGASAAADWAANKTIALPDWRGRTIAGLDDMGNSAAGVLTNASTGFGSSATVLGNGGGNQSVSLSLTQLPTGITGTITSAATVATVSSDNVAHNSSNTLVSTGGAGIGAAVPVSGGIVSQLTSNGTATGGTITSNNTGGGAHPTIAPTRLATIYLKL